MKVKITVGLALVAIVVAAILIFFPRQTAPASPPDRVAQVAAS
jgi:poly-D-alanine transfer protein DltD